MASKLNKSVIFSSRADTGWVSVIEKATMKEIYTFKLASGYLRSDVVTFDTGSSLLASMINSKGHIEVYSLFDTKADRVNSNIPTPATTSINGASNSLALDKNGNLYVLNGTSTFYLSKLALTGDKYATSVTDYLSETVDKASLTNGNSVGWQTLALNRGLLYIEETNSLWVQVNAYNSSSTYANHKGEEVPLFLVIDLNLSKGQYISLDKFYGFGEYSRMSAVNRDRSNTWYHKIHTMTYSRHLKSVLMVMSHSINDYSIPKPVVIGVDVTNFKLSLKVN
ncbi:hypothetical protein ThvES_00007870, partial [Thiovulum sp. ES]